VFAFAGGGGGGVQFAGHITSSFETIHIQPRAIAVHKISSHS